MANTSLQNIMQRELNELKEVVNALETQQSKMARQACTYQLMRTIEALFMYLSDVVPGDHETADAVIHALHEHEIIDDDMSSALQELCDVNQYLLDVENADLDFIEEIVAYGHTYMQAIEIVYDTVRNANSITQVENNGAKNE